MTLVQILPGIESLELLMNYLPHFLANMLCIDTFVKCLLNSECLWFYDSVDLTYVY